MSRELETFLSSLRGATSDVTGVTDRMKALEKEQDLMSAYAQAPEMIRGGDVLGAGAQLAQAGDPFVFREQLKQMMQPQEAPVNPELLAEFGVDPSLLAGLSPKEQLSAAKALGTQANQRRNVALGERAQTRLEEQSAGKPKDWFDAVGKIKKDFRDQERSIKNVQGSYELGKVAGDAVLFNYVARNIAGEKGPLSDGDVARIIASSVGTDQNKILNYFKNKDDSVFTPEQRKTIKSLIDLSVKNYDAYKNEAIMSTLGSVTNLPALYKDGKLDKRAEKYFKEFGFDLKTDADGFDRPEKVLSKKKEVMNADQGAVSGNQEAEITKVLGQIKDPQVKAQAEAAIKAFAGKTIPPEVISRIKQAAGGQ